MVRKVLKEIWMSIEKVYVIDGDFIEVLEID